MANRKLPTEVWRKTACGNAVGTASGLAATDIGQVIQQFTSR